MAFRLLTALRNVVVSADPASPVEGDMWWRTDTQALTVRASAATLTVPTGSYDRFPYSIQGTVAVSTGVSRMYIMRTCTFVAATIAVNTAPVGASLIADIKMNGTSIFTGVTANRPTITAGTNAANAGTPATTSFTAGSYLTVDILQVGSTTAGADFTCTILVS